MKIADHKVSQSPQKSDSPRGQFVMLSSLLRSCTSDVFQTKKEKRNDKTNGGVNGEIETKIISSCQDKGIETSGNNLQRLAHSIKWVAHNRSVNMEGKKGMK